MVRGSGEEAPSGRPSGYEGQEEIEGPKTVSWVPEPCGGSGLPATCRGPVRQCLQLGASTTRQDPRISFPCVFVCVCVHIHDNVTFREPVVYILHESFRLEQSEDRGDASARDQAAQLPAGIQVCLFHEGYFCSGMPANATILIYIHMFALRRNINRQMEV